MFSWAEKLVGHLNIDLACWSSSTAFSGIGCPEIAAQAIRRAAKRDVFTFKFGVERDHMARAVLSGHAPTSVLHCDILAWLPDRTCSRVDVFANDQLRAAVFDGRFQLDLTGRTGERFSLGDCHTAGPPCGFFAYGCRRREGGPSMLFLYVWVRALREQALMLAIIEIVTRCSIALLVSLFGDLYTLDHFIIDKDFESPARRRRLYVVMTLRGKLCLWQPLANLVTTLRNALPCKRSWELLFCLKGADDGFFVAGF